MSTIVINVDDKSSAKIFLELARKMRFKARVLTERQMEELALVELIDARKSEPDLPVESALNILKSVNAK